MADTPVISVRNLSKSYRIYDHPLGRLRQGISFGGKKHYREFEALMDISFDIQKGEAVGIIGRNGSGKSTLLQLICGIRKPTSGQVIVNGRISALLELGTGFHPEFTGRENVFMQGAIMGFTRSEMEALFDDIALFADIGEFIDQPVKTYSSGMFVRLAFSVAMHSDPDLLIVDEALAVGDEAFQRKCFSMLERFRDSGKTLILVSHSASVIATICQRALLLDQSHLIADNLSATVLAQYQKLVHCPPRTSPMPGNASDSNTPEHSSARRWTLAYPSAGAFIDCPQILDRDGQPVRILKRGEPYTFQYQVSFQNTARQVRFTMMIKTLVGFELGGLTSHLPGKAIDEIGQGENRTANIQFICKLLPGTYFLNAGVLGEIGDGEQFLHRIIDILSFEVEAEVPTLQGGVVDFS